MMTLLSRTMKAVSLVFGTLLATSVWIPTAWAQSNYFGMCYSLQNIWANSPYLPWSVFTTTTLTTSGSLVNGIYGGFGYQVTGATGTRTLSYQGKTSTISITGVVAPGTYNGNDNIIQGVLPVFDNVLHGISFQTSSQYVTPAGPLSVNGNPISYFNINNYTTPLTTGMGLTESDLPLNDGQINIISSQFYMTQLASAATAFTCPFSAITPNYAANSVAAYQTTSVYNFCYQFTGGPGDSPTGGIWYVAASGTFTVQTFGQSVSGATAYLVTGVSGTRQYIVGNGTVYTSNLVSIGGVNSPDNVAPNDPQFSSFFYSNNVFYPTFPYFDQYGVTLQGSNDFSNVDVADLSSKVLRIFVDPSDQQFEEWVVDFVTGYYYEAEAGSVVFSQQSVGSGQNSQCSSSYGTLATYQYCYYIDGTSQSPPFFDYAYGTVSATGPATRQGRTNALLLQTMQGVRVLTMNPGASQTQTSMNIINLQYIKEDIASSIINDNVVFMSGTSGANGPVTSEGILFTMAYPPAFPGGTAVSQDISLTTQQSGGALVLQEASATNSALTLSSSTYSFNIQPYVAGQASVCGSSNSAIGQISLNTYQFCYYIASAANSATPYSVFVTGVATTYSTGVLVGGRLGYPIQSLTGTRTITIPSMGIAQTQPITGLLSNSSVSLDIDVQWEIDDLIFPTWPYLSGNGIGYTLPAGSATLSGPISGVAAVNIYISYYYDVIEETLTLSATTIDELMGGSFSISTANAAASAFNATAQCNWNAGTSQTYSFCYWIESDYTDTTVPWSIIGVGLFTAVGPQVREGRQAYTMTSMQGIRQFVLNGVSYNNQILELLSSKYDLAYSAGSIINDNVVYATPPYLDDLGLLFRLDSGAYYFLNSTFVWVGSTDINLYYDQFADATSRGIKQYVDWNTDDNPVVTAETTITGFNYAPFVENGQASRVSCQAPGFNSYEMPNKVFAFCYSISGATYTVSAQGYITTIGIPVGIVATDATGASTSQIGYVATGINGTRTWTPTVGSPTTTNILGLVPVPLDFQNWDNIVIPIFPYVDVAGITFYTDGVAYTAGNLQAFNPTLTQPNWFNLYNSGNDFQELSYTRTYTNGVALVYGDFFLYAEGNGAVSQTPQQIANSQCAANAGTMQTLQFCYVISPTNFATGLPQYNLVAYGTFNVYGPVTFDGRQAYKVVSGNMPYPGARVLIDGTGATSYQYFQTILPTKADLSSDWINDNIVFTASPYLDQWGLIFTMSSNPTYPDLANYAANTSSSNQLNLYYNLNPSTILGSFPNGYVDQDVAANSYNYNYASDENRAFQLRTYSVSTYPPQFCDGVAVPQGVWTTQTGGVISTSGSSTAGSNGGNGGVLSSSSANGNGNGGNGGNAAAAGSSSSSGGTLSNGAVAGLVVGLVIAAILLTSLCCFFILGRGGKSSRYANNEGSAPASSGKYSYQPEESATNIEMQPAHENETA